MTRRDYNEAARIVRERLEPSERGIATAAFLMLFCSEWNFDRARFVKACEPVTSVQLPGGTEVSRASPMRKRLNEST